MNKLITAALLGALSFGTAAVAQAQTGPAFPEPGQNKNPEAARTNSTNAQELARNQRRAAMSPAEIKQDQQLALLEARTGNTSFGAKGPDRQFDSNRSGGGFRVRKFKAQAGKPGYAENKRGQSHFMGSSNPEGKPLVHKHKGQHRFLFF
ncbi:hypothetical protein GCM10022409_21850 [Hymenobacter glaciei]|uniref:Uncharacterized protein n=1 Tax=Hymenobacter glaciei TaxID=877209 RepID=A0ABP7U631_9BACT